MKPFVVFCGCGTWSLTLRRDCGCLRTGCWGEGNIWPWGTGSDMRAGENNAVMSSIIFTAHQASGASRYDHRLPLGKCLDPISEMGHPHVCQVLFGGLRVAHMAERKNAHKSLGGNLNRRDYMENLCLDDRIILKCVWAVECVVCRLVSFSWGCNPM
jgi:hypothetical protein